MVSETLVGQARDLMGEIAEPYERVEQVTMDGIAHVRYSYILRIIELSEARKELIVMRLQRSWRDNQDHGMVRRWGRAAVGVLNYLILPTLMSEVDEENAADVVFRLSRWSHSRNTIWQRFRADASFVVEQAWREIENLCANPAWSRVNVQDTDSNN